MESWKMLWPCLIWMTKRWLDMPSIFSSEVPKHDETWSERQLRPLRYNGICLKRDLRLSTDGHIWLASKLKSSSSWHKIQIWWKNTLPCFNHLARYALKIPSTKIWWIEKFMYRFDLTITWDVTISTQLPHTYSETLSKALKAKVFMNSMYG